MVCSVCHSAGICEGTAAISAAGGSSQSQHYPLHLLALSTPQKSRESSPKSKAKSRSSVLTGGGSERSRSLPPSPPLRSHSTPTPPSFAKATTHTLQYSSPEQRPCPWGGYAPTAAGCSAETGSGSTTKYRAAIRLVPGERPPLGPLIYLFFGRRPAWA
jgi:hypothetical protein